MQKYQCDICNKNFTKKNHLDNHKNRKNKCQPCLEIVHENTPKIHENTPKLHEFDCDEKYPIIESNDVHKCNYCNKTFSRKNVVYKHIKESCKIAKQQNKEKQEIYDKLVALEEKNKQLENEIKNKDKMLEEEIKNKEKVIEDKVTILVEEIKILRNEINAKQPTIISNSNNTTNSNNTVNVINIVPHGQEDLMKNKVDDLLLILATKKGYNAVLDLITRVHFNPRFPEFQNVYIPDIKNNTIMVFDEEWSLKNTEEVISNLYDTKTEYIMDNKDIFYKHLNVGEQAVYARWAESNNNRDTAEHKEYIRETHKKIKLLMYNKKDMVIATKKLQSNNNKKLQSNNNKILL